MDSVWLRCPGFAFFKPLVQAGWPAGKPAIPNVARRIVNASRVYLPSIVELPNGNAIVAMKLGVKEVEASGMPFAQCAWGLYVLLVDRIGQVLWADRFPIHKGNGQVVRVPGDDETVMLVASTGIAWKLRIADHSVVWKGRVTMGPSGEKCFATSNEKYVITAYVGYTNNPSGVARIGVDSKSVFWASKPPFNDMGSDMVYASAQSPWGRPKGVWTAVVLGGQLRYNYLAPKGVKARFPPSKPGVAGAAASETRFAPALFQLPGYKKGVGVAYRRGSDIVVQVLDKPVSARVLGRGAWPSATCIDGKPTIRWIDGEALKSATVTL